jgi:NAD-dependent dihydropyrimidine dehydrogenase PreA subunit
MIILEDKCTGCNMCIPYCPASAIVEDPAKGVSVIIEDECAECGVCYRSRVCPVDALFPQELEWPRTLRAEFSDVAMPYISPVFKDRRGYATENLSRAERYNLNEPERRVSGRGTNEMKNNDTTGRFKRGFCGIGIEFGRGCGGARFREVEKMTTALAAIGVGFEKENPMYHLLAEPETGKMLPEILNEKVLSCIIEFSLPLGKLPGVIECIRQTAKKTDAGFSLCLISCLEADGSDPVKTAALKLGLSVSINGKVNVGLGRPLADVGG